MLLYYKIACMYFTVDEFDKCIEYTNLIMSNKILR